MFKRPNKLNGWQRIGIVVSVAWVLYGFYWGNDYGLHQGDWAYAVYNSCIDDAEKFAALSHYSEPEKEQNDIAACELSRDKNWISSVQYHWDYAAICAFVPIPLGWGIAYGLIALARWIRRGFSRSEGVAK